MNSNQQRFSPTVSATSSGTLKPVVQGSSSYQLSPWDLSQLLSDSSEETLEVQLAEVEQRVVEFEELRPTLSADMTQDSFLEVLRRYESIFDSMDRLGGFAGLRFSADTQSSSIVAFRDRIRQHLTHLHNRFLFFSLWWKELSDEQAEHLTPSAEEHHDYRHYLAELRRFKPYTLVEASEQIINIKNANGIDAVITLYAMLTNRMEFQVDVDGETQTLNEEEMRGQFFSSEPDLRVRTYGELFRVYENDSKVLAQIYANRVRDWHTENVELRGFSSPIAVRNLNNDVSDQAVDTMLDVVAENTPLFHEYFRLKGQWLGFEPLRRYDVYAPLASSTRMVPYPQAVDNVLSTFRAFDPGFGDLAEKVFRENHVDSEIRKGKRGGAFCATISPQLTPWVLLNYTGKMRDVATLAHELGHAVHSMLASDHSLLTHHAPLPLAETASVFSEMLMTDRMLKHETDPLTRRELLATAMDDIYATVVRQTYFVRFEKAAHAAVMANQSADDLFDLYAANLAEQFGDAVDVAPQFRYEWLSIPHLFNTPFYCYAYSFGQLLVLALYRRYQQEGDAFIPGYLRLLSYGGSRTPADALAEMDIDISSPEFWQGGFDVVRGMLDELRSIEIP